MQVFLPKLGKPTQKYSKATNANAKATTTKQCPGCQMSTVYPKRSSCIVSHLCSLTMCRSTYAQSFGKRSRLATLFHGVTIASVVWDSFMDAASASASTTLWETFA